DELHRGERIRAGKRTYGPRRAKSHVALAEPLTLVVDRQLGVGLGGVRSGVPDTDAEAVAAVGEAARVPVGGGKEAKPIGASAGNGQVVPLASVCRQVLRGAGRVVLICRQAEILLRAEDVPPLDEFAAAEM